MLALGFGNGIGLTMIPRGNYVADGHDLRVETLLSLQAGGFGNANGYTEGYFLPIARHWPLSMASRDTVMVTGSQHFRSVHGPFCYMSLRHCTTKPLEARVSKALNEGNSENQTGLCAGRMHGML